ncbi:hypothetical protein OEZ86_010478 [Tetradesmus obliquus]|nr:hypothetical protein OEZ86_010478 [Tetradesmus obliquus]
MGTANLHVYSAGDWQVQLSLGGQVDPQPHGATSLQRTSSAEVAVAGGDKVPAAWPRYTPIDHWGGLFGGAKGFELFRITGSFQYKLMQVGPLHPKVADVSIKLSGSFLGPKNETIGLWKCVDFTNETPPSSRPFVSPKFAAGALDAVTIRQSLSTTLTCGVSNSSLGNCTARLAVRGSASREVNDRRTFSKCMDTNVGIEATRTTMQGYCDVVATNSNVLMVVECGAGRRFEAVAISLDWLKAVADMKP